MKRNASKPNSRTTVPVPAFQHTGPQIFHGLRIALTDSFGFQPSFSRLGKIIGEQTNLTHYWFKVLPHHHLIGFFCFLERLPEPNRIEFLKKYCRDLPRIDHPRLAHDPLAVGNLETLLRLDQGLTWIQGGTEYQRTWLITALGHSFSILRQDKAAINGIDIHEPRKLVPVETLVYLKEPLPPDQAKQAIRETLPSVCSAKSRLILLNGVWSMAAEMHEQIFRQGLNQHVVLTVDRVPQIVSKASRPVTHVITLAPARENEQWIRLKVEAT
jgi:hypothetical protein